MAYSTVLPYDAGITLAAAWLGVGYAVAALGIVIFLEAQVMKKHFAELDLATCRKYSFVLNVVSAICGLPLLFLGARSSSPQSPQDVVDGMAVIPSCLRAYLCAVHRALPTIMSS